MQQAWLRNQACLPVQLLEPERGCEKIDGEGEEYGVNIPKKFIFSRNSKTPFWHLHFPFGL